LDKYLKKEHLNFNLQGESASKFMCPGTLRHTHTHTDPTVLPGPLVVSNSTTQLS